MVAFIEQNDFSLDTPTLDGPEMDAFEELLANVASSVVSEGAFADRIAARLVRQVLKALALKAAIILTNKSTIEPWVSWISALDPEDIPMLAAEIAQGLRLALGTNNPQSLRRSLHAWKSTANYAVSGPHRELKKPDWDALVRIMRPADDD
jgi:hypothetical protein